MRIAADAGSSTAQPYRPAQHRPAVPVQQQAKAGLRMPCTYGLQGEMGSWLQVLQEALSTGEELGKAGQGTA